MARLRAIMIVAIAATLFTSVESAQAYVFFDSRDEFTNALQGSITTENFALSDGLIAPGTTFESGLAYADRGFFLGGAEVSDGELLTASAFPGSTDVFEFPSAVKGFGFDFRNVASGGFFNKIIAVEGVFGSFRLSNDPPVVEEFFESSEPIDNPLRTGFFGVIAEAGDPLIEEFIITGSGEFGQLAINDVSFATPAGEPVTVPERSSLLSLLAIGVLGAVKLHRKAI